MGPAMRVRPPRVLILLGITQGVQDLEADARAEQDRINAAREWKCQRDCRSGFDEFLEDIDFLHLFHEEAAPARMEPIPQMNKMYDAPPKGQRQEFVGSKARGRSRVSSGLHSPKPGLKVRNGLYATPHPWRVCIVARGWT